LATPPKVSRNGSIKGTRELGRETSKTTRPDHFEYDVCLSFAGENRGYVEQVAENLRERGVRVFYDEYERIALWGKDLYSHLDYIYRQAARYCVVFVSRPYASKLWTNHERRSAQARAFAENREYVLPARFDNTEVPGIPETVGYLDVRVLNPHQLADCIAQKLGPRQRACFFPPVPDLLFQEVGARSKAQKDRLERIAYAFFEAFSRMSEGERLLITMVFLHGCHTEIPKNVHISLDLLRRLTKFPVAKIKKIAGGLKSIGFTSRIRESEHDRERSLGKNPTLVITFHALLSSVEPRGDETGAASHIVEVISNDLCAECATSALLRADFSQLAKVTSESEEHAKPKPRAARKGH